MALPVPELGLIISYGYLWRSEYEQGQEEGLKERPCAIVMMIKNEDDETVVSVVPITHSAPANPEDALEIPLLTKQRLGLDSERSWVVVNEINRFIWPGPDLRPVSRSAPDRFAYGVLPPSFFRQVRDRLRACAQTQKLKNVSRTT